MTEKWDQWDHAIYSVFEMWNGLLFLYLYSPPGGKLLETTSLDISPFHQHWIQYYDWNRQIPTLSSRSNYDELSVFFWKQVKMRQVDGSQWGYVFLTDDKISNVIWVKLLSYYNTGVLNLNTEFFGQLTSVCLQTWFVIVIYLIRLKVSTFRSYVTLWYVFIVKCHLQFCKGISHLLFFYLMNIKNSGLQ